MVLDLYKFSQKGRAYLFTFVLLLCAFIVIFNQPFHEVFYYWSWGQHLALSYYDGPPMVAYILRLVSEIFGSSVYTLNALAVVSNLLIAYYIYSLSKQMFSHQVGWVAALMWLLTPMLFVQFGMKFVYDTPAALFWMATIFYFYSFHRSGKLRYLYIAAVCSGCMMLSKYTGILLFAAIFLLMVFSKHYRHHLKNKHLYFSILLALAVFSPVIIWNIRNGFASFAYQWHHGTHPSANYFHILHYVKQTFDQYLSFFFLFLVVIAFNIRKIFSNADTELLIYCSLVPYIFFLVVSPFNYAYNWNETYFLTAVILAAYFCQNIKILKILTNVSLWICLLVVTLITAAVTTGGKGFHVELQTWQRTAAAKQMNKIYDGKSPIVSDSLMGDLLTFYLHGQPTIYSLYFGNQNWYWSQSFLKQMKQRKLKKVYYGTTETNDSAVRKYFDNCRLALTTSSSSTRHVSFSTNNSYSKFYVYECTNKQKR